MSRQETTSEAEADLKCRVLFWCLGGVLAILPVLHKPGIMTVSNLPKETFYSIALGLALAGFFVVRMLMNEPLKLSIHRKTVWIAIYGMLAYGALSLTWVTHRHLGMEHVYFWTMASVMFFLVAGSKPNRTEVLVVLAGLAIGASLNAGLGLYQLFFDKVPSFQNHPPAGSFVNKNFSAQLSAAAIPVAIAGFFRFGGFKAYLASGICAFLCSLHLFHTFTRASWIGAFLGLMLLGALVLVQPGLRRRLIEALSGAKVGVAVALIAIFCIAANYKQDEGFKWRFGEAVNRMASVAAARDVAQNLDGEGAPAAKPASGDRSSITSRFKMWRNAVEMLKDNLPLGVGEGNFQIQYPPYSGIIYHTRFSSKEWNLRYLHLEYLELMIELGIVAIVLGPTLLYGLGLSSVRAIFRSDDPEIGFVCAGALCGLVAICATGFFSGTFYWPAQRVFLFTFFGVIVAASAITAPREKIRDFVLQKWVALLVVALALGGVYYATQRYYRVAKAENLYIDMVRKINSKNSAAGLESGSQSLRYRPHFQQARMTYAATLFKMQRYTQALENMELLAADFPYDYRNRSNMALLYLKTDRPEDALKTYELMLKIVPGDKGAAMGAANLLRKEKEYKRAEEVLLSWANGHSSAPDAYVALARNAASDQRIDDAIAFIQQGLEKFPEDETLARDLERFKQGKMKLEEYRKSAAAEKAEEEKPATPAGEEPTEKPADTPTGS